MDETTIFDLYVFADGKWSHARSFDAARKDEALSEAKARSEDRKVVAVRLLRDSFALDKPVSIYKTQKSDDIPEFDARAVKGKGGGRAGAPATAAKREAKSAGAPAKADAKAKGAGKTAIRLSSHAKVVAVVGVAALVAILIAFSAKAKFALSAAAAFAIFAATLVLGVVVLIMTALNAEDRRIVFYVGARAKDVSKPTKREPTQADFEPKPARPIVVPADTVAKEAEEAAAEADDSIVKPGGPGHEIVVKVLRFFEEALAHVVKTTELIVGGQLDGHARFGCHLFLAGAVDGAAGPLRFPRTKLPKVIEACVAVLGTAPEQGRKFAKNYEEYLVESKNREMFAAGRDAIDLYDRNSAPSGPLLARALEAWVAPDKTKEDSETVAVMFTDIVGSTDYTQTHGDKASQDLVHAHNDIVRRAIAAREGREVKHTGDGIMASFPTAADAVAAAIGIQSGVAAHGQLRPDLPLKLRIGVSYGRPIHENDDLFGSTVQLAARICGLSGPDEILISLATAEALDDGAFKLEPRGQTTLKGFPEPQDVHQVVWS